MKMITMNKRYRLQFFGESEKYCMELNNHASSISSLKASVKFTNASETIERDYWDDEE